MADSPKPRSAADANLLFGILALQMGHTGFFECVAFSPDGQRLASGSTDNTVKVWGPACATS